MATEKIRGIILAEFASGENSKYIVVLAQGIGKIRLLARGARKPKSALMAGTQVFCYCDFMIYEGRGFQSVTQAEIIESFYNIRTDLDRLTEAARLLKLLDLSCVDGENYDASLNLLLHTLWLMAKKDYSPKLATAIFFLKHLQFAGLMPITSHCVVCENTLSHGQWFHIQAGGFVCKNHQLGSVEINTAVWDALCYIFSHEGRKAFQFTVSDAVLHELSQLCTQYIRCHWHLSL